MCLCSMLHVVVYIFHIVLAFGPLIEGASVRAEALAVTAVKAVA